MMRSVSLRRGGSFSRPLSPPGYRYYRLRILANGGRNTVNIAELQLRGTQGGPNLAVSGTAIASSEFETDVPTYFPAANAFDRDTATYWSSHVVGGRRTGSATNPGASSSPEFGPAYTADHAFDGRPETYWSNTAGGAGWLGFSPGGGSVGYAPDRYAITARSDAGDGAPRDWALEYSDDGTTWDIAHAVSGETGWGNGERRGFAFSSVGSHTSWRIRVIGNNGRSTLNIAELEFIGYTWGTIWLQYDFGVGVTQQVVEYAIAARSDAGDGAPRDWELEASNDLITWTPIDSRTDEADWAPGETRTYTVQSTGD